MSAVLIITHLLPVLAGFALGLLFDSEDGDDKFL
jgi:hypothetical protein